MINAGNISAIYVSQKYGHDGQTGFKPQNDEFQNGPVKRIERAFDFVKQMRRAGYRQPITIRIVDDEYIIEKPIMIDEDMDALTITPNTKTVISGGRRVNNFVRDTFNGTECFSAVIPEVADGIWYTDFYVDGKRAELTRYPECGTLDPVAVEDNSTAIHTHITWFKPTKEDFNVISKFKNINDCIVSYHHYWVDEHSPIKCCDAADGKIELEYASGYSVSSDYPASAMHFFVENVAEMFFRPNQWYLDRSSAKLYYIPDNDKQTPENINAYLPVCDKIFEIKGSEEKPVKNIYIKDFELAYTRGDSVWCSDDGLYLSTCGQSVNNGRGCIEFEFAKCCAIEHCNIHSVGVHAIRIYDGCRGIKVADNDIYDIGAGGVVIGGAAAGGSEKRFTSNNTVYNNIIKDGGKRYQAACGILLCHTFENIISHNDISDMYYTGISAGWVWGYGESISNNNVIEYNHIFNIGKGLLSDMGGIYTLGRQEGTIIRGNLIHDVTAKHYGGWGIYTDEGSSYMTIEDNICYRMSNNCYHQHYGAMNTVRNNIFAMAKEQPIKISHNELHTISIFERNIIVSEGKGIYNLTEWCDGGSKDYCGHTHVLGAHDNLIFDADRDDVKVIRIGDVEYGLEEAQKLFGIEDGTVSKNPEFVDYEKCCFMLKETSPALGIGFKLIDPTVAGAKREEKKA